MFNQKNAITKGPDGDGIDRRGFLKCMQWAGGGVVWSLAGGVAGSRLLEAATQKRDVAAEFTFVQISDSHIGFNQPANPDVNGTLQAAVDQINAMDHQPDLIIHTGDLTHLAKADEFDSLEQILGGFRQKQVFYVPGEHDFTGDDGKVPGTLRQRRSRDTGWHSFDHKGVHFVGVEQRRATGGTGENRAGAAGLDEDGARVPRVKHAGRRLRAHSAMVRVPGMGLGDIGQRRGARPAETLRFGNGAERPHSSGDAKGGRPRRFPHRDVHRVPATRRREARRRPAP